MRKKFYQNPFEIFNNSSGQTGDTGLDWEESALDSQSQVEGFAEETRTLPKLTWLHGLILGACAILVFQLFNLQIIQGSKLKSMAEGNRLRIQTILAPRGFIVDRYGQQLARNTASFSLAVTPVDLPEEGLDQVAQKISASFGVPVEEINERLKDVNRNSLQPIILKRGLTQQQSILFETHANEYVGFSIHSIPIRDYLDAPYFSHALGYTGVISESEMNELGEQEGYDLNDFIGKSGIELAYEKFLRGVNGNKQVEVDASGRPLKILGNVEPEPGNIVQLNIDAGLQAELYKGFADRGSGVKGAAVALNPKTGEVLALVSVPGYNNNLFAPGISGTDYQALLDDKNLPLFNRAISGTYPPGSTIKMVTAAAALQENIVKPETIIYDNGALVIPNQFNPGIVYNFYGWKRDGLGPMNVRSAIAQSSDIYFYTVAGGHPNSDITGLGAEKLAQYYRNFGMGAQTGIDIQGEKSGIVADPAWKESYFEDPIAGKWYLGDTYHVAIGQGDMLTTPLQVAIWTGTIANGGTINKPRLLKTVTSQDGKEIYSSQPEILVSKTVSDENIKVIQWGMRDNVITDKGSGRQLNALPISSAGKTGTSQFDGSDPSRTHAWFTSYAPFEDPEIVITVLVEAGGEGHAAAVPIVKNALQWWAENRYKK